MWVRVSLQAPAHWEDRNDIANSCNLQLNVRIRVSDISRNHNCLIIAEYKQMCVLHTLELLCA